MALTLHRGATSKSLFLFVQDGSGNPVTGLTSATTGLALGYIREGDAAATAVPLVAGTLGSYTSGGFIQVDAAKLPGWYQVGLPNAALAAGNSVVVSLFGAAGMLPTLVEIALTAVDPQDAQGYGMLRLLNLANQGQSVALGNGSGGFAYSGTVTLSGQAQAGVVVKCYNAQDTAGTDQNAIVDLQTLVAQATSDGSGQFSFLLAQGYYALVYVVAGTLYQYYLRWSTSQAKWLTSTSPIAAS